MIPFFDEVLTKIEMQSNEFKELFRFPKWTKCVLASGSLIIPKDGTYKITACGAGGLRSRGGGGCAIDQRAYNAGDVISLTVSGLASAICSTQGLSITANGTANANGATASGGNVANYTGGNAQTGQMDSLGCAAGAANQSGGGTGGVIGGEGGVISTNTGPGGNGGAGGIVGGPGGGPDSNNAGVGGTGGTGGVIGGKGGTGRYSNGGAGGTGGVIGGNGGDSQYAGGGNGGNGGVIGGNGGRRNIVGTPANVVYLDGVGGAGGAVSGRGTAGGFSGMGWAVPFAPEIAIWTFGNAIIFLEEVV